MHHVFVNQVRSRASESSLREEGEPDIEPPDRALDLLNIGDMDAVLSKLPVDQREVLLLLALEDMSYLEAAHALDIPVGTVMSRLSSCARAAPCPDGARASGNRAKGGEMKQLHMTEAHLHASVDGQLPPGVLAEVQA